MNLKDKATLDHFIKKRLYLIWHTQNYEKLSEESIVEAVLNYGDYSDVLDLIKILGIKKMAKIFRQKSGGKRSNFRPEIKNYFNLYFDKHAG